MGTTCIKGLVDEYHLAIHPVVLGAGLPIFDGLAKPFYLKLIDVKVFPVGSHNNPYVYNRGV
jgi:dihydrofolate reductase